MPELFLKKPYDYKLFKNQFLNKQFDTFEEENTWIDASQLPSLKYIKEVKKLWTLELQTEDWEEKIVVLEIHHRSQYDPRVSLTKELFKIIQNYEIDGEIFANALAVFVNSDVENRRLSLLTTSWDLQEWKKILSNPRRFSFLLWPGEKTRTAKQQLLSHKFETLQQLKEAFSVEPVRKEFFKKYLELFVRLYIKVEKSGFKQHLIKNQVDLVNFTKNLLGRIVFLYFIQKKWWLGVPENGKWWDGDKDFLRSLWEDFSSWENWVWEKTGFFYNDYLEHLFFDALNNPRNADEKDSYFHTRIPYLNWWLFKPEYRDWDNPQNIADIDNDIFSNKNKDGILDIFDQYNFTIDEDDPYDQEVAIDPEMLGRIFETMISVDRKNISQIVQLYQSKKKLDIWKELNKKFGAFYTPRQIVHYMTKESLILYLARKLQQFNPNDSLSQLEEKVRKLWELKQWYFTKEDLAQSNNGLNEKIFDEVGGIVENVDEILKEIKIIDPAVGSWAFPMGILQEIATLRYYIYDVFYRYFGKDISKYMQNDKLSLYKIKKEIVWNNIFGVDIEPGAIDIARLRFWLSLVVDAIEPEPLPNFEFKFVAANSLIPLPEKTLFTKDEVINKLKEIRLRYFNESSKRVKEELQREFYKLRNELIGLNELQNFDRSKRWAAQRARDNAANIAKDKTNKLIYEWDPFDNKSVAGFFDPQWMFGVEKFDIVIGNPPYVSLEKIEKLVKEVYKKVYKTFASRGDLYVLFIELGYNILAQKGILSYITSNKYTRANYGKAIRKFLLENTSILEYIDFNGVKVFENATVDTSILKFEKLKPAPDHKLWYCDVNEKFKKDEDLEKYIRENGFWYLQRNLSEDSWNFLGEIELKIKEKVEKVWVPLKKWNVNIYRGILTWLNEAFLIDEETKDKLIAEDPKSAEIIKPILRWRDIDRYKINFANLYLLNVHNNPPVDINQYPAIKKHLDKYYDRLAKRYDKWDTPYNLRNCAYLDEMEGEKIVYSEIVQKPQFYFDEWDYYVEATAFMLTWEKLKYLLGLLNSKFTSWAFRKFYMWWELGSKGFRYKKAFLENLPIPRPTPEIEQKIVVLVDKILEKKKKWEDTLDLERQIDEIVYDLYGLTEEERRVVEESF